MGIAFPLIMGTISLDEMMNMFVVGGANMPWLCRKLLPAV